MDKLVLQYATVDQRNAVELRAEIARLQYINEQNAALIHRQQVVLEWLQAQAIVITPEMCWTPGGMSLQGRIESEIAMRELRAAWGMEK